MVAIRGHFDGKVFVPDEPVDLPCNQPLVLHIQLVAGNQQAPAQSALEWLAEQAVDDPSLPADISISLDHYLYGKPKQQP